MNNSQLHLTTQTLSSEGEFDSLYLQDIDDDLQSGIRRDEDETALTPEDYGDMHTDNRQRFAAANCPTLPVRQAQSSSFSL
jgi:hypothetical protein